MTAYAIPLTGITIDGKLDDWPEEMAIYPIGWVSPQYYTRRPPEGPEDLSAGFRVGYDAEAGVLYLAVVVRDDEVVVHPERPDFTTQDACEVYVDGDHSGGDSGQWVAGAQKYHMVPGPGVFSPLDQSNPDIREGDIVQAGVQAACLRTGDITTYEWAIPLFEQYPHTKLRIEPDRSIGFDVVVVDADGTEAGNWVAWTPESGKVFNSSLLGDLVFVEEYGSLNVTRGPVAPAGLLERYADLGAVAGAVTRRQDGSPWPGVAVWADEKEGRIRAEAMTGADGGYLLWLSAGAYRVLPRGAEDTEPVEVVVRARERADGVDFAVSRIVPSRYEAVGFALSRIVPGAPRTPRELSVPGPHAEVFRRAVAYEDEGKIADAAAEYRLYLKKNRDVVPAYFYLANLYWDAGDQGRALETLKRAEKACPT